MSAHPTVTAARAKSRTGQHLGVDLDGLHEPLYCQCHLGQRAALRQQRILQHFKHGTRQAGWMSARRALRMAYVRSCAYL